MRAEGTQGDPPRPRLRCFYIGADGKTRKHGFRPPPSPADSWGASFGGRYTVADVAEALVDLARGASYTEAARRVQLVHAAPGSPTDDAPGFDGRLVATWVDRFAGAVIAARAETRWPPTVVLDSTEFTWTNPRTGDRTQLFTVLAAWGYPAGARRGRLWALAASPRDNLPAWQDFLRTLPGAPELVIYDSDKGIEAAVATCWPTACLHLCEHHLHENATKALHADGQHGHGNLYHGLLAHAAQSLTGWSAFRNTVHQAPQLVNTNAWVDHWDGQLTAQTARRPHLPEHRSTGALDPHLAKVRSTLQPRAWTYRNLPRMNALLGLVRLSINLLDRPTDWAPIIAASAAANPTRTCLDEPANVLESGERIYSLRTHPVPPRALTPDSDQPPSRDPG